MKRWAITFGYEDTGETDTCYVEAETARATPEGHLLISNEEVGSVFAIEFNGPVVSIKEDTE